MKGKRELTLEDLDNIDYDELCRIGDASRKLKELREERPWVRDIIRVLWGFRSGTTIDRLTKELWSLRNPSGLPEPKAFKKTVQSALNHHTCQSKLFKGSTEDDLFSHPKDSAVELGPFTASGPQFGCKLENCLRHSAILFKWPGCGILLRRDFIGGFPPCTAPFLLAWRASSLVADPLADGR